MSNHAYPRITTVCKITTSCVFQVRYILQLLMSHRSNMAKHFTGSYVGLAMP